MSTPFFFVPGTEAGTIVASSSFGLMKRILQTSRVATYRPSVKTLARLVAGIGCTGLALQLLKLILELFKISLYRRLGTSSENKAFQGNARQPLCSFCNPTFAKDFTVGEANWCKKVSVSTRCSRCCLYPAILAGSSNITIGITGEIHRSINLYSTYQLGKEREVHNPMMTVLDNSSSYDDKTALLMNVLGTITDAEHETCTWAGVRSWNRHTRSYRNATPWYFVPSGDAARASTADTASPYQVMSRVMRPYWDWVQSHAGCLPQVSEVNPDHTVLNEHSRADTGDADPYHLIRTQAQVLAQGTETTAERPAQRPMLVGTAKDLVFEARGNAVKVGPLLSKPLVHNVKDSVHVTSGIEFRCLPEPGHKYDSSSASAKRLCEMWAKTASVNFTPKRINAAFVALYGEASCLSEVQMASFSRTQIENAARSVEGHTQLQKRKANAKLELVEKECGEKLKPVRLTYDNGLELLTLCYVVTKIFQELIYGKDLGMFYANSIKSRSREKVMSQAIDRWMKAPKDVCGFEIDQTGMERHERGCDSNPGLMTPVYTILKKICSVIQRQLIATNALKYQSKLIVDHEKGLCFHLNTVVDGKKTGLLVSFSDLYLDSGWALTSGVNFTNELYGVLVTCFENPDKVFQKDKDNEMFLSKRTTDADGNVSTAFNWKFRTVPIHTDASEDRRAVTSYFDPSFEGDDGAGMISRLFLDPRNQKIIEGNQKDLGYCAKLKFVENGRLEYIGIHIHLKDGRPATKKSWSPGVMRTLGKIGAKVGTDNSFVPTLCRFLSLAGMFAGSIQPMAEAFLNSALRMLNQADQHYEDIWAEKITVKEWDELWKQGMGVGIYRLRDLYDDTMRKMAMNQYPTDKDQIKMMNVSMFEKESGGFTGEHFARFQHFAAAVVDAADDEALFCLLPQPMWPG